MAYIQLVAGFVILILSGKYLVRGGADLARKLNVSKLVIGITIISFGTSAPELFVSIIAANNGHPGLAVGNVIGSNIANIALVLAITAIIIPMPVKAITVRFNMPFMLAITALFYIAIADGVLTYDEGLSGVVLLAVYIAVSYFLGRKYNTDEVDASQKGLHWAVALLFIALSSLGLAYGSDLLVKGASEIAAYWGVNERIIAITVVAFGTSLPELVTSVIAALQKEMDISVGNIVGSNIFNILAVLGITGIIQEVKIEESFINIDILWVLAISLLLFLFILPFKGGTITRWKGVILMAAYAAYLYVIIM